MAVMKPSEFGGDDGEFQPEEKGAKKIDFEKTRIIYRSDPMDPAGAAEIVTERVV